MSVSYNTSEFSPSSNTTIHHTATVNQGFYSNGQLASVTRTAVHDSANLKKIDELIKFAYNANGQLQSQTTSYVPRPNSTVRQPGPTSTRDPKFDRTPGGRIADDNQFTYKYDKEGNLIERVSKFSAITIDDLDSSFYATTTSWFSSQAGNIPISTTAPSQQYSGGGLGNIVTATVDFPQVDEGVYDVWTTWKSSSSLGSGTYELFVQDDFTRANTPPGGFGWGMLRDESTGLFRRTTNSSDHTYVPVDFRVDPRDTHDDGVQGLRWFSVGTVQVDSQSKLSLRLQKDTGQVAIDGFRLTPHVRREVIEYDQANRPTHSLLYSERALTARTETYYAYDVTGKMVAVRNRDLAEDSKSTLGFAYQGNQQLLSFSLDTYSGGVNEYGKIKSFNLLGTQGEVLGIDSSKAGQPVAVSSLQQTVWQINNLDGTRFTDTNGWFATNYAFAGQKLASTNTDYLTQSRDAHRNTWNGGAIYRPGGIIDQIANVSDTWMVAGTIVIAIPLAFGIVATAPGIVATAPVFVPTLGYGGIAFYAGGVASGAVANGTSEYLRGGNGINVAAAAAGGGGLSYLNPLSGYTALAGGGIGASIAYAGGGDVAAGFQ